MLDQNQKESDLGSPRSTQILYNLRLVCNQLKLDEEMDTKAIRNQIKTKNRKHTQMAQKNYSGSAT